MKPVTHESNTRTLNAPAGWNQDGLPVEPLGVTDTDMNGVPCVMSFWQPDAEELAHLQAGALVGLSIVGHTMPPAAVVTFVSSAAPHADDLAVDRFAAAMKKKLAAARAKGRGGWERPDVTAEKLSDMLREHVDKGDPRDVANFCMFLHNRGEGIAAPSSPQATSSSELMSAALVELADDWDDTAAMAEKYCVGDDLFQGEARGLRSAAKELREFSKSETVQKDDMCREHHAALQRIGTTLGLEAGTDLHQRCVPAIERLKASKASEDSYATAFYEIASVLGIGARVDTPENVFRREMLPKIIALASQQAASAQPHGKTSDAALVILVAIGWVITSMDASSLPADARDVAKQLENRFLSKLSNDQPLIEPVFREARRILAGVTPPAANGAERERLRQVLGEVLSETLAGMCEDDVAPDWYDSRHIDEVLDVLMPVIRVHFDPELSDPSWSALHPEVGS